MGRYAITAGKTAKGARVVLYGVEGIGKMTLAAQAPGAVFLDTEGSTLRYNLNRYPIPSSWEMLTDEVIDAGDNPDIRTLVIDSGDWAEKLCVKSVCAKNSKKGIEDFGYGAGYQYAVEEFGKLLNLLSDVTEKGKNVIIVAHAAIRSFTNPEEMGQYNRYTLELLDTPKCSNASALKEWADAVLFANYKDYIVEDDKTKKKYAQGGERVLYTQRTPAWDAKNRFGLQPVIPMTIEALAPIFADVQAAQPVTVAPAQPTAAPTAPQPQPQQTKPAPVRETPAAPEKPRETAQNAPQGVTESWTGIPQALVDLMKAEGVEPFEVRLAVSQRGYYPSDVPVGKYDPDFINGVLVGAWPQVLGMIKDNRAKDMYKSGTIDINSDELPF